RARVSAAVVAEPQAHSPDQELVAGPPPLLLDGTMHPRGRRDPSPVLLGVGGLTVLGAAIRLSAGRSLWLDEATSVAQARLPFGQMLTSLRTTDVQPPLHDAILW